MSKLNESDRKALEIREEMEERIRKEREQLEKTKQELQAKDHVIDKHLNDNVKLSNDLQNEQNRRLELEKQLEELKVDAESKVASTANWAQEQGQKNKRRKTRRTRTETRAGNRGEKKGARRTRDEKRNQSTTYAKHKAHGAEAPPSGP